MDAVNVDVCVVGVLATTLVTFPPPTDHWYITDPDPPVKVTVYKTEVCVDKPSNVGVGVGSELILVSNGV